MKDFEQFYTEVEAVSADVSALIIVLDLYYNTFLYSGSEGGVNGYRKFCDWMHIINRYANDVMDEIGEMMKRNM